MWHRVPLSTLYAIQITLPDSLGLTLALSAIYILGDTECHLTSGPPPAS